MRKYICIEGIIGSGKTTLIEQISKKLFPTVEIVLLKERFENNKLLELFYQNPNPYRVLTEYGFLIDRFHQIFHHFSIYNQHFTLSDFTFRKCLWFAENNLTSSEYNEYRKHFLQLEKDLNIFPEKIIFLNISPQQASQNIKIRNRTMERNITLSYLEKLYDIYIKNINNLELPVFSIDVDDYEGLSDKVIEIMMK